MGWSACPSAHGSSVATYWCPATGGAQRSSCGFPRVVGHHTGGKDCYVIKQVRSARPGCKLPTGGMCGAAISSLRCWGVTNLEPSTIRVGIIEDQPTTREALRTLLDGSLGYSTSGAFGSMEEGLSYLAADLP